MTTIPGYTLGTPSVPRSPITLEEFERLKQVSLLTPDDLHYLRLSREVLADQVEAVLDVWYGFMGSIPDLMHAFVRKSDGQPDPHYLEAVRARFAQWILDTAEANYDQAWLDYQYEIGLRHHRIGKNKTDGVDATDHIPYRYIPALIYPVTATLKPFLEKKGHRPEEVEKMHQAWIKSIQLQVLLWGQPYMKEGDF
jgi:hypothetical protein